MGTREREEPDDGGHHRQAQRRAHVPHGRVGRRLDGAALGALLLVAVVHLDGEVDAEPEQDREARDRDQGERDARQADGAEGAHDPDGHDHQGEQPPPDPEDQQQQQRHHPDRQGAQRGHAAPQVVVDLGEEHGRPTRQHLGSRHRVAGDDVVDHIGAAGLVVDRGVAREAHDDERVPVVEEVVAHGRADLAVGPEQEEVDEGRVVERLLAGRREPGQLAGDELVTLGAQGRLGGGRSLLLLGGREAVGGGVRPGRRGRGRRVALRGRGDQVGGDRQLPGGEVEGRGRAHDGGKLAAGP
jgi:hypothetical protein